MKQFCETSRIIFGILIWMFSYSYAHAGTYFYVAPTGNDLSNGSISQPFATITQAARVAQPGDTIYVRGGTYILSARQYIGRSGSSGNRINLFSYSGESPIIDGGSLTNPGDSCIYLDGASWWDINGLEIKNCPYHGIQLRNAASNNIVEHLVSHRNGRLGDFGDGINVAGAGVANNLVLNNDCHHNGGPNSVGGADGIGVKDTQAVGNIVRGNRVWRNSDDGIDLWNAANVLVENNWSWENGYNDNLQPTGGNGEGFKLGGAGTGDGAHTIRENVAWGNYAQGFANNRADLPMTVFNNTAFNNGSDNFDFAYAVAHIIKNNLSVNANSVSISSVAVHSNNSWELPVTVNSLDFVTLDFTANTGARQSGGSLPVSSFLQLVSNSDLIDKGVNVGIAYIGAAPDLGAYEYVSASPGIPQAPSNLVVQ